MFETDRSSARGKMAVRELIVIRHDSELSNAPAYKLFETLTVKNKDFSCPPRGYHDYNVQVATASLPAGVTCERMI